MNIVQADIVEKEYGEWPSFHDAEIMRVTLSRGLEAGKFAKITADINLYYTKEINKGTAQYEIVKTKDNVITIEFYGVESVVISEFNYQNVIDDLILKEVGTLIGVEFQSIFGVEATFTCEEMAVLRMVGKNEYKA